MGRDWAPFEHYLSEQRRIKAGDGDLFDFLENLKMVYNDGTKVILHSAEEMALRRQFPSLGRLLMDDFPKLYEQCSQIEGGLDLLHKKDDELTAFLKAGRVVESEPNHSVLKVDHTDVDKDSYLIKWFTGTLDEHFYYCERNNSLFCSNVLLEAQLHADKIWVCVYKDALGYQDDHDNLTDVLLPREWLENQLKSEGIDDFEEWYFDYTADDTDDIARKALEEGIILECSDKRIALSSNVVIRSLNEGDKERVEVLDDESGNNVADGIDSEDYAWGLFLGSELIGYCTVGGADDTGHDGFEMWTNESLCLSDVYIHEGYRGQGYASQLINEALKNSNPENQVSVFITLLDDKLSGLYEKLGFKTVGDGVMVRKAGTAPSLESQIKTAAREGDCKSVGLLENQEIDR